MFEGLLSFEDIILKCMYTVMYSFLIKLPRNGNDEQKHLSLSGFIR